MSNKNYPYIQYETYEMEPYNNIIPNLNYLKENKISLPFQSNFAKEQYISIPQNDASTSLSNSDKYLSNTKYFEDNSFEAELRKKYNEISDLKNNNINKKNNNNECNCDCHKKCSCNCYPKNNNNNMNINLNINELLNELSNLKANNLSLLNDVNNITKEKNFADAYIKELEKENARLKNISDNNNNLKENNDEISKTNKKLIEMLDQVYKNILITLS